MTPAQIAQAILDGKLRPRVGEIARMAEALLDKAAPAKPAKAPKKGAKKSAAGIGKAKKADSKKAARKLAKIPGQKKKKK